MTFSIIEDFVNILIKISLIMNYNPINFEFASYYIPYQCWLNVYVLDVVTILNIQTMFTRIITFNKTGSYRRQFLLLETLEEKELK